MQREGREYTKEKNKQARFGTHEKNMSQRPVGFENTQMTAQIGPRPDGVLVLFTTPRLGGGLCFN